MCSFRPECDMVCIYFQRRLRMEKLLEKLDDAAKLVAPMLEEKNFRRDLHKCASGTDPGFKWNNSGRNRKAWDRFCGKEQPWRRQKPDQKIVPERGGSGFTYFHTCHIWGVQAGGNAGSQQDLYGPGDGTAASHRSLLRGKITAVLRKLKKLSAKKAKMSGEEHGII